MLKQRIITALLLIAILLPALFAASPWPFAVLLLAMIGAAGWEWGRLNAAGAAGAVALGVAVAVAGALTLAAGWHLAPPGIVWWLAMLVWVPTFWPGVRTPPRAPAGSPVGGSAGTPSM